MVCCCRVEFHAFSQHLSCDQAMMKDQFGNYVVQKVLEICDDQNRELILSRVKVLSWSVTEVFSFCFCFYHPSERCVGVPSSC